MLRRRKPREDPTASANPQAVRVAAEVQINAALRCLGLSYAEAAGLCVFDSNTPTAAWSFDRSTGVETILIGPKVANLPLEQLTLVLRHEFLHRYLLNGFGEAFTDAFVTNLALDICINRLLADGFPKDFLELCRSIFPERSKTTVVALCDASAAPARLPPELGALWRMIWTTAPDDPRRAAIQPLSLYHRLKPYASAATAAVALNPFAAQATPRSTNRDRLHKAVLAIAKSLRELNPGGSATARALEAYAVEPIRLQGDGLEAFTQALRIRRVIDPSVQRLTDLCGRSIRREPFAMWPSRLDLVFRLTGLSDTLGIYHNLYPARSGARLAVGFYVDVSGSMIPKLPTVLACAKAMREIPLRLSVFDTAVRSADWEQLAKGKVEGGGGTNFTPVVQDMLAHPELLGGIIVTDGQGELDDSVARSLSRTHQEVHVLYVLGTDEAVPSGSINSLAKQKLVVRVAR